MSVTLGPGEIAEIKRLPSPFGVYGIARLCGIPKTEDGRFYCPSCDFVSDEIEDFAVGMCWNCMYEEEE